MKRPDEKILRTIKRLKNHPDFVHLMEAWIEPSYALAFDDAHRIPFTQDRIVPHWIAQGQFQELFEIVETIKHVDDRLKELANRTP